MTGRAKGYGLRLLVKGQTTTNPLVRLIGSIGQHQGWVASGLFAPGLWIEIEPRNVAGLGNVVPYH